MIDTCNSLFYTVWDFNDNNDSSYMRMNSIAVVIGSCEWTLNPSNGAILSKIQNPV